MVTSIYHFRMVYAIGPLVFTIWYIPYGMYHDIYHGIYHAIVVYTRIDTMVYTIWPGYQGCVKLIPKMFNMLNPQTVVVDACDSQLHQDYTKD
jgi:hypothetical protein